MARQGKRRRFLAAHPYCCFCGGAEPSTTIDHVPAKICFAPGYHPEPLEFPACNTCNLESSKFDQVAGFFTQVVDFGFPNDLKKHVTFGKALRGVRNNKPSALPNVFNVRPILRVGNILTPKPVAFETKLPPAMKTAVILMCQKITHALYYRHTRSILSGHSRYRTGCYQLQNSSFGGLTAYLAQNLSHVEALGRKNQPNVSSRFQYRWNRNDEGSMFMYGAQFGEGVIVWGMVLAPGIDPLPRDGPLKAGAWRTGGDVRSSIEGIKNDW